MLSVCNLWLRGLGLLSLLGLLTCSTCFSLVAAPEWPAYQRDTVDTIRPAVRVIRPEPWLQYRTGLRDTFSLPLRTVIWWDELDTLPGFIQRLGLIGKPYRNYRFGWPARFFSDRQYRNPLTGHPNVYYWNPETQLRYYDTHTPFFLVQFTQAAGEILLLTVDASQNITPYWNMTVRYRRRSGVGDFRDFRTDHYQISVQHHIHSLNDRFQLFGAASFQQNVDQFNGGSLRSLTAGESFLRTTPFRLSRAQRYGRLRSLYLFPAWELLKDSSHVLRIFSTFTLNEDLHHYTDDQDYTREEVLASDFPYPQFWGDSGRVHFSMKALTTRSRGGADYTWQQGRFRWMHQGQLDWTQADYPEGLTVDRQTRLRLMYRTELKARTWRLRGRLARTFSSLFAPENRLDAQLTLGPAPTAYRLTDSLEVVRKQKLRTEAVIHQGTYRPWVFTAKALLHDRNPEVLMVYGDLPTFQGNDDLENMFVAHLRGSFRYTGLPAIRNGVPFLQNTWAAGVFYTQGLRRIFFDSDLGVHQAPGGAWLVTAGAWIEGRQRWGRFYFEPRLTVQRNLNVPDVLERYAEFVPALFGRARIYFQTKIPRKQIILNTGIEAHYFTAYEAHGFEPSTEQFYPLPANETLPGYVQFDVWVSVNLLSADVFLKLTHVNSGIMVPGYYTTPFQPMLQRNFNFGIRWRFYD